MKQIVLGYRKNRGRRFTSLRQVLGMMSKDWNVLLIILTLLTIVCWSIVTKTGGVTTFIKH